MPQADLIYSLPDDHDALKDTVIDGSICKFLAAQPQSLVWLLSKLASSLSSSLEGYHSMQDLAQHST